MAAAMGSSITDDLTGARLGRLASRTARRSTSVTPEGMQMTTRGRAEHAVAAGLSG